MGKLLVLSSLKSCFRWSAPLKPLVCLKLRLIEPVIMAWVLYSIFCEGGRKKVGSLKLALMSMLPDEMIGSNIFETRATFWQKVMTWRVDKSTWQTCKTLHQLLLVFFCQSSCLIWPPAESGSSNVLNFWRRQLRSSSCQNKTLKAIRFWWEGRGKKKSYF